MSLRGAIDQSNAAVEARSNESAADGVNNVLMQGLKVFQRPAGVLEFDPHLPQLSGQQATKISHGEEGKQVNEDDRLQRLQFWMCSAIRMDQAIVIELKNCAVKDESQRRDQMRPYSRQQDAGNDNDQGIKKIQRTIPASGLVHHQADQGKVGENLQCRLEPVLLPEGKQQDVKKRQRVPQQNRADEQSQGERSRRELCDQQLQTEQECQYKNSNLDQPGQPIPLVERRLHCDPSESSKRAIPLSSRRFVCQPGEVASPIC